MNDINEKEIVDKIKTEIHRIHPILNPRKITERGNKSVMEIYFSFSATYDNIPIMFIDFLDGNENYRTSTSVSYELNKFIDFERINELISYLITEYPHISDFSISSLSFSLDFEYPFEMSEQKGTSCDKIILEFNVYDNEFIPLLNQYLTNILVSFTEELSKTKTFQHKYTEYCNKLQKSIVDSMNNEEINKIVNLLPIQIKRELLQTLPSQYFLQFYQEHSHQDEQKLSKKLIKKENKSSF